MRTHLISIFILLVSFPVFGQNESDALRFSQNYSGGTARSLGLSGAMGALGGDPTVLSINPAGLGVYRASEFTITMGVNTFNNSADYLGTSYDDNKTKFNISNLSYIYSFNTNNNNGLSGLSFGVGYNRLNDFNSDITIVGKNAQSSLLDEFVYYANGIDQNLSFNEQKDVLGKSVIEDGALYYFEGLAFKTNELIFLNEDQNSFYNDFMDFGYDQEQRKRIVTSGGMGEYDFSLGANISHILYLGATLGIQNISYERIDDHIEYAPTSNEALNSFQFKEHFNVYGNGVNFKMGAILKPVNALRLGLAYHSPTYFNLESEFYTTLDADFDKRDDKYNTTTVSVSEYTLKTPSKLISSLGLVLDKYGLISIDVERVNYRKAHYRSDDYDFVTENQSIKDAYNNGSYNVKFGAEGKIGIFAIRGGYAKYGKPYKEEQINSNSLVESYSGGFGIRGKSMFFDLAYVYSNFNEYHKLYQYERFENGEYVVYDQFAKVKTSQTKIMATLGFRF